MSLIEKVILGVTAVVVAFLSLLIIAIMALLISLCIEKPETSGVVAAKYGKNSTICVKVCTKSSGYYILMEDGRLFITPRNVYDRISSEQEIIFKPRGFNIEILGLLLTYESIQEFTVKVDQ